MVTVMGSPLQWRKGKDLKKTNRQSQIVSYLVPWMTEGRKSQVVLLDERRLDIVIQPKLYAADLLDMVASHFSLKEKEYFGLSYLDDSGHHNWLQLDRKVLEHDLPRKNPSGTLLFYFGVRFFIESIGYLRDSATIELFYLQAKQAVFKGTIDSDSETAFELAAHVLQATHGDFLDDDLAKSQLKKLPVLPTSALKEHPSIQYCEERVTDHYKKLAGISRGIAIVNYMTIIESLPTYGIHYYEVKDKNGLPWWLGLSYKGIAQYDYSDKRTPRRVFPWKQLENLYFRDKKFSIEVHDPKRIVHTLSSFNLYEDAIREPINQFDELSDAISDPTTQVSVSRRTFGPGNVNVYAWFAASQSLTKAIWSMAVCQHQFYLDRKNSKAHLPSVRSMSEIANEIAQSTSSLPGSEGGSSLSYSGSSHSLSKISSKSELSQEQLDASRAAQRDMFAALKARKEALEEALKKKTEELKLLCIKEGELTGVLPKETPMNPGDPVPQIQRRVGTSFMLSTKLIDRDKTNEEEEVLNALELEFEIQTQITSAALKLAQDSSAAKGVRKTRRQTYQKALKKLKDIEIRLNAMRKKKGQELIQHQASLDDDSLRSIDSVSLSNTTTPTNSPVKAISLSALTTPTASPKRTVTATSTPNLTPKKRDVEYQNSPVTSPAVQRHMKDKVITVTSSPKVEIVEVEQGSRDQDSDSQGYRRPSTPSSQSLTSMGSQTSNRSYQSGYSRGSGRSSPSLSPQRQPPPNMSRGSTPSPRTNRHPHPRDPRAGYMPSSVYTTRTAYRSQMYPTFSSRQNSTGSNMSNMSDYENSGRDQRNRFESGDRDSLQPNLYNVNTLQAMRYDSTDELKTPPEHKKGPFFGGSGDMVHVGTRDDSYLPSKHNSLEGAYKRQTSHDSQKYGSLERNITPGGSFSQLTPSKFGSKRESHSDLGDYFERTPMSTPHPNPQGTQHKFVMQGGRGRGDRHYSGPEGSSSHQYGGLKVARGNHGGSEGSIPYIDSAAPKQEHWYESKDSPPTVKHGEYHNIPGQISPRYDSPLHSQPRIQQDIRNVSRDIQKLSTKNDHQSPGNPNYQESPNPVVTVTKFRPFREVTKPYEISDFYKYSEKLRRQRSIEQQGNPSSPSTPQSDSSHSSPTPYSGSRSNMESHGQVHQRPAPGSPYTQRAGPPQHQQSPYANYDSSPYHRPQLSPASYEHVRERGLGSYTVQSVQTSHYQAQTAHATFHSQHSPRLSSRQAHYTAPQPMTCEPVVKGSSSVRSTPTTTTTIQHRPDNTPTTDTPEPAQTSKLSSRDISFTIDAGESLADAFSEEMLAWYEDQEVKPATLV